MTIQYLLEWPLPKQGSDIYSQELPIPALFSCEKPWKYEKTLRALKEVPSASKIAAIGKLMEIAQGEGYCSVIGNSPSITEELYLMPFPPRKPGLTWLAGLKLATIHNIWWTNSFVTYHGKTHPLPGYSTPWVTSLPSSLIIGLVVNIWTFLPISLKELLNTNYQL